FFLPLTFVAMIWPATARYARRLVEFLIALILAKLVIVAIIGLAAAALTNSGVVGSPASSASDGQLVERMIAGGALLVLAAYSPLALLRAIPLIEGTMMSVGQTKRQAAAAVGAGASGVQSSASHLRHAMTRQPDSYPASTDNVGTTSSGESSGDSTARASFRHDAAM